MTTDEGATVPSEDERQSALEARETIARFKAYPDEAWKRRPPEIVERDNQKVDDARALLDGLLEKYGEDV